MVIFQWQLKPGALGLMPGDASFSLSSWCVVEVLANRVSPFLKNVSLC